MLLVLIIVSLSFASSNEENFLTGLTGFTRPPPVLARSTAGGEAGRA